MRSAVTRKCPLLETGRNSVIPCTMAKSRAARSIKPSAKTTQQTERKSLDGNRLGQVPGLVHVAAAPHRDVVSK